jgi:hypothetical protein
MQIDQLMDRFTGIPGARVGHGPRHPRHPDPSIAGQVDEFLDAYPALRADPGYVEFLERYGGASIENEKTGQIVDILGFTDASTDMIEMDGPIVDDNGFLVFAQCVYHLIEDGKLRDTQEHDFAFDTTGRRDPRVYHLYSAMSRLTSAPEAPRSQSPFEMSCDGFVDWLAMIVNRNGMLEPPPSAD